MVIAVCKSPIPFVALPLPAPVEGVSVSSLSDTSVRVSWDPLVIEDATVTGYTVVYSQVSGRLKSQDGEMSHDFAANATSGVITGLESGATYQFQVLATAEVNGSELVGDRSPVTDVTRVRVGGEMCAVITGLHAGLPSRCAPLHRR